MCKIIRDFNFNLLNPNLTLLTVLKVPIALPIYQQPSWRKERGEVRSIGEFHSWRGTHGVQSVGQGWPVVSCSKGERERKTADARGGRRRGIEKKKEKRRGKKRRRRGRAEEKRDPPVVEVAPATSWRGRTRPTIPKKLEEPRSDEQRSSISP